MRGHPEKEGRSAMSTGTTMGIERVARALVYLVYFWVMLSIAILVMGFFLLLFGANPDAPFSEWAYRSLDRVMAPFRGIFESVQLNGESVLDTSVLFAMIVYGIVGIALSALIHWLTEKLIVLQRKRALQPEERTPVSA